MAEMKADACLLGAGLALLLSIHHATFVQEQVRKRLPSTFSTFEVRTLLSEVIWTKSVSSETRRRHVIATAWGTLALVLMSVTAYRNGQDIPALILVGMGFAGTWTAWRYLRRYRSIDCKDVSAAQLMRRMFFGPSTLPPRPGSPTDRS